jgi:hypothetical protein
MMMMMMMCTQADDNGTVRYLARVDDVLVELFKEGFGRQLGQDIRAI